MAKWMLLFAAVAAAAPTLPAPALAQTDNGVLIIYGDDKCPTDSNGDEIVVCARRPETERYRIPKELRDLNIPQKNRSWTERQKDLQTVGDTGTGSCSAVGEGGFTGCMTKEINKAAAERKQREKAQSVPDDYRGTVR